ncbi:MAG TPA: hypothetical protein PKC60_10790 [Hydrogenophaga sp.]|uniref:hypothetical protein n=1 Tax=Hydrogenophaga sp. TaxID=1904254 RepID=UPI002C735266|nr:hypothetical protein [Hydrogenophaga sp.]HMN93705.1 hypothetical protein [Hydrogenophaga sp.]HMP09178.1 hypothetical protein [Hydrogenophaga sp.]
MNTATLDSSAPQVPVPWWRVPHMWLVLGLLLSAVIGSTTAAVIAVKVMGNDPVLDKAAYERDLKSIPDHLQGEERMEALIKLQPARQARNNAASPVILKAD